MGSRLPRAVDVVEPALELECFRKSVKRFSDKKHDKEECFRKSVKRFSYKKHKKLAVCLPTASGYAVRAKAASELRSWAMYG